jgi:hypothetical protein
MKWALLSYPLYKQKKPVTNVAATGFLKYMTKLMEATAYKKLKGVFDEGN